MTGSTRANSPESHDAAPKFPSKAFDAVVNYARAQQDGCAAVSSNYRDGKPTAVVLIATSTSPERVAVLDALHTAWYPEEAEDDD